MRAAELSPGGARVAVAVSGGADSMALVLLACDWAGVGVGDGASGGPDAVLTALTVDHGLRPNSAAEAETVGRWCAGLGVAHRILTWEDDKPEMGIQAAARKARYRLLADWCRVSGYTDLLVGHTQNDQAETFLFRMSRGSGVDGLAAMALVTDRDGLRIVRPLLTVPRTRVEATALAVSQTWIEDPSNADRRYARVRIRQKLADMEAHGVSTAKIADTARVFGHIRAAKEAAISRLAAKIAALFPECHAEIEREPLRLVDRETAQGLVTALLAAVGGRDYPPRREQTRPLMEDLIGDGGFRARTLGNCVVALRHDKIAIRREHRTIRDISPVVAGDRIVWDGRFAIEFGRNAILGTADFELRALGETGWQDIASMVRENAADGGIQHKIRGIPGPVRYALPAVWQGETVVEVPHLNFCAKQIVENIVKTAQLRRRTPILQRPFWVA